MKVNVHCRKWMLLAFTILSLLGVSASPVFSQNRPLTGVVKGDDGIGIPGVTVLEKGTSNGTVTDADGNFTLTVREGAVLSVSFIGMKTQEITVGNQTSISLVMEIDVTQLDEVVVVGYGEVSRRDLTSSVSSVGAKQLKDIPLNSAAEALSGRLAGVQVVTSEGAPGADVRIRVRGGGSITQDNSPLYVVDGIQVENALQTLSPQDIESIDVLKDASATAIYGARGANGVVIITTKGGKNTKTTINYSGIFGVRQLANKLGVMNPYEFVLYQYDRSRNSQQARDDFQEEYGYYEDIELYKGVPFVDWQEDVFGRSAAMQTHNLSIAGGSEATQFNLSLTSNLEEGVMLASDLERRLVNFRFDHKVSKKFKTGFNLRYNNTVINGAGTATEGSSSVNRLRHSVKYRPFLFSGEDKTTYDPEYANETNANSLSLINPILLTAAEYRERTIRVTNINGYGAYDFTDYLTLHSTLGVDLTNEVDNIFNDSITNVSQLNGSGMPMASVRTRSREAINNSNVLTFSSSKLKALPEEHKFDVLLGQETYQVTNKTTFTESGLFPNGITPELAFGSMQLGTVLRSPSSAEYSSTLVSFFTRGNYVFNDKYFASVTMRADGSSKFSETNKWGYFPSASLAWRVSNESFFQSLSHIVNDLKLRVSYGESGNNRIDDFLYLPQFTASAYYDLNNSQVIGFAPSALANNNLKWETTISQNIGMDASLYNNRLQLSLDAYTNTTRDLLLDVVVPSTSGYRSQLQNVGETQNYGIELQLSGTPIDKGDFRWTASFNISYNRNMIEDLGAQESFLYSSGWAGGNAPADYIVKVGQPVGSIWGLETDGFYTINDFNFENGVYTLKSGVPSNQGITSVAPQPGTIKFKDIVSDGIINDQDRTVIGDATPSYFGGINNQFAYKNFDLSVFINYQYGNDVLNANKLEFTSGYTPNANMLSEMNGRWRNVNSSGQVVTDPTELAAMNENATIWSPLTSASSFWVHSWAVEDGSFLRINNITLGYSLPKTILSKARISNLRVYGTVNNLAVFTNYSGYDPEVNTRRSTPMTPGVDYAAYPKSRTYIFGINVTL